MNTTHFFSNAYSNGRIANAELVFVEQMRKRILNSNEILSFVSIEHHDSGMKKVALAVLVLLLI